MGDFLTKPVTEKNPTDGKNDRMLFGACSMQGWRKSNEDAHIHKLDLGDGNSLFAVFDGHGGEQVALFCERYFAEVLMALEAYKQKDFARALEEAFVELDFMLLSDEGHDKLRQIQLEIKRAVRGGNAKLDITEEREIKSLPFQAGCTACVCLVTNDTIYCANAGDSRAVLVERSGKVIELSEDHKPDNEGELKRIKEGGGFVEEGRVQGIIAVSRAIGDWEYKNPALQFEKKKKKKNPEEGPYRRPEEAKKHQVSSFPDIRKVALSPELDFLIVACDGIWDCFSNEEAAKFVRTRREKGPKQSKSKSKTSTSKSTASSF
jgi:protein phosphatase 1G